MNNVARATWIVMLTLGATVLMAEDAEKTPTGKEGKTNVPTQKVTTFLMFEGKAEEAMKFYVGLFKNSKIVSITKYGKEGPGAEGTVKTAIFTLNGQEYMAIDSPAKHQFTFTASISLFVKCDTEKEVEDLFKKLSDGGQVFMALGKYPFSDKFGWVADKFGVSWQLILPKKE